MKVSVNGRKRIRQEEGEVLTAYKDSRGTWTIGVGHTSDENLTVTPGLRITAVQSDNLLERDLREVEQAIDRLVVVQLNQNQYDALASLIFNIGVGNFTKSTVLRKLNAGDYKGAADAMLMWKRAGNDPDILLPRRNRERVLFLTPVLAPEPVTEPWSFWKWIFSLLSQLLKK